MFKFRSADRITQQPANKRQSAPRRRKLQRGQSLIEVAFSLSILLLIFSGAIDLGRAFFTKILLDSAISEGAHWAAAYPGCLTFGVAQNASASSNVDPHCTGTNSIYGRILTENDQLDQNRIQSSSINYVAPPNCDPAATSGVTRCTSLLKDIIPGDTVVLTASYRVELLTPVMRGLFGSDLTITSYSKEVVRGTGMPPLNGVGLPQPTSNNPALPINNGGQTSAPNIPGTPHAQAACMNGLPVLWWQGVASSGYKIYPAINNNVPITDADISDTAIADIPVTNPLVEEGVDHYFQVPDDSAGANSSYQEPPYVFYYHNADQPIIGSSTVQGSRTYAIRSYIYVGGSPTPTESDPYLVTANCASVQPDTSTVTMSCNTTNTGMNVSFYMLNPSLLDRAVAQYQVYQTSTVTGNNIGTPMTSSPGFATFSSSWNIAYKQATFILQPQRSDGTNIGIPASVANIKCGYTSNITVAVTDNTGQYDPGTDASYTVTVTNNSGDTARGIVITGFSSPTLTNLTWTCNQPASGADCAGSLGPTTGTSLSQTLNLPAGTSITLTVTGKYPTASINPLTMSVTANTTQNCPATDCILNGTTTASDPVPDVPVVLPKADLSVSYDVSDPQSYTPGSPATYTYNVTFSNAATSATAVNGATVTLTVPINIGSGSTATWQCSNTGGGTCASTTTTSFTGQTATVSANLPIGTSVVIKVIITPSGTTSNFTTQAQVPSTNGGVGDSDTSNNTKTVTYNYNTPTSDLGLTVTSAQSTYSPPGTAVYTVKVYNAGPAPITTAKLDLYITPDSSTQPTLYTTSPKITCSAGSGANCGTIGGSNVGATAINIGSTTNVAALQVPTGTSAASPALTYTVTITVPSGFPAITLNLNAIVTITNPTTNVDPQGSPNPNQAALDITSNSAVSVDSLTTLTFAGGATSSGYTPGYGVDYYVTVANQDNNTAISSPMSLSISFEDTNNSFSSVSWASCSTTSANCPSLPFTISTSGNVTTISGITLAKKGGNVTFKITGMVKGATTGSFPVKAYISAANYKDPDTTTSPSGAANSATLTTSGVTGSSDVQIVQINDSSNTYVTGQQVTYAIIARDNFTTSVYGAKFSFTSNSSATFGNPKYTCVASSGSSCPSGSSSSIQTSGPLTNLSVNIAGNGGTVTFYVTITVPTGTTGNLVSTATITTPNGITDITPGNDSLSDTDYDASSVDVSVSVSDGVTSYVPGSTTAPVTYTVTVSNSGPAAANTVTVYDSITGNLIVAGNSKWYCTASNGASCGTLPTQASQGSIANNASNIIGTTGSPATVNLPANSFVQMTLIVYTTAKTKADMVYSVTANQANGINDINGSNNSTSSNPDTDKAVPDHIAGFVANGTGTTCSGGGSYRTVTWFVPDVYWYNDPTVSANKIVKFQIRNQKDAQQWAVTATQTTISGLGNGANALKVQLNSSGGKTTFTLTNIPSSYAGTQFYIYAYDGSGNLLTTSSSNYSTWNGC